MRRIDARRGTENFKALFPTEFELLAKNQQGGGPLGPPSSGRGLKIAKMGPKRFSAAYQVSTLFVAATAAAAARSRSRLSTAAGVCCCPPGCKHGAPHLHPWLTAARARCVAAGRCRRARRRNLAVCRQNVVHHLD